MMKLCRWLDTGDDKYVTECHNESYNKPVNYCPFCGGFIKLYSKKTKYNEDLANKE